ncbi:MBL fold metallo-hydrolase [Ruminiclostridium herbifermentans]|uniref:MBL fold metallo-hydrolase n=1 Tax=Ruminiclostridium herbifermentans TaxID=2488810 RepID=A0A4U7J8M6_9FIRM|nr:MBL fold metallo-hydrolase [Ruminiclostridium herbifermentans]QNU67917.1 MBL fold metallo-hydrolase [Ruminiclostridium herbifermentans]
MELSYSTFKVKTHFLNMINYSYIVVDNESKKAIVVDPAWEIDKIINKLNEENAMLTTILLTHSHEDHTNLANALVKRYNANVYMSEKEINYYGFRCGNLHGLNDFDEIYVNKTKVSCILTAGHTAGGMCYLLENCIFTGDTLFSEGCGLCYGNGASAENMYDSIQKLKSLLAGDILIFPGHSYGVEPGKPFGYLGFINAYLSFDNKKKFVEFRNRKNIRGIFNFK